MVLREGAGYLATEASPPIVKTGCLVTEAGLRTRTLRMRPLTVIGRLSLPLGAARSPEILFLFPESYGLVLVILPRSERMP